MTKEEEEKIHVAEINLTRAKKGDILRIKFEGRAIAQFICVPDQRTVTERLTFKPMSWSIKKG